MEFNQTFYNFMNVGVLIMAVNGKNKGSSFEREISKFLNELFDMKEAFSRSAGSGSRFGGKNSDKLNIHNRFSSKNSLGDISSPDGIELLCECKSYANLPFHQVLQGDCPQINKWLDQVNTDNDTFYNVFGEYLNKLLIFKINRAGIYFMIPKRQVIKAFIHKGVRRDINRIEYRYKGEIWFILTSDSFTYEPIANSFIESSRTTIN